MPGDRPSLQVWETTYSRRMNPSRGCTGLGWIGDPHGPAARLGRCLSRQWIFCRAGQWWLNTRNLDLGESASEPGPRERVRAAVNLASAGLVSLPRGVGTSRVVRTRPTGKQGSGRDWGWGQNNGSGLEFFVWRGSWGVGRPAQGMLRAQDVGHPARASGICREGIPAARITAPGDAGAGGAR